MKVLGLESATSVCAAAIVSDGRLIAERTLDIPHVHSEKMLVMIEQALVGAGCTVGELDGIAISIGPGSFTGLRIGLSVAKGLAFATGKPLIAVSTLEALAWNAVLHKCVEGGDLVASLIDARRAEVYAAVYSFDNGSLECRTKDCAMQVAELHALFDDHRRIVLVGDGVEKFLSHHAPGSDAGSRRYFTPPRDIRLCSAFAIGSMGEKKLLNGESADLLTLEPTYVKDFQTMLTSQHART